MIDAQLHRDIGQLQARVAGLEAQMAQQLKILAEMQRTLSEARGGWRALMWLGGAGAALGAAVTSLVTWLRSGGHL